MALEWRESLDDRGSTMFTAESGYDDDSHCPLFWNVTQVVAGNKIAWTLAESDDVLLENPEQVFLTAEDAKAFASHLERELMSEPSDVS